MGKKLRSLLNRLTDIKTRTLLIVVGVVILVVVGMVLTATREAQPPDVATEVKAARIGDIASLAGTGEYNEEYAKLQLAENERAAQQAQKTGDAAIPRLINQQGENKANLSFGQEFCAECVYDAQGYDQNGYDAKGYDRNGYAANGYDRNGYDANGFDKDGFDASGYDANGYNKDGFDANGYDINGYNKDGYDANGYDINGFDKDGYDASGYNKDGFDRNGCNREGLDVNGNPCYDEQGYNPQGYDRFGFDKDGFDAQGFDKDGYDRNGFNSDGCNREGLDKEGKPCFNKDGYNALGFDKDGYDKNGFDQNGYDKNGFGKDGYNKDGFDKNGFDKDGYNKDGFDKNGFDKDGYNKEGFDKDGYDKDGFDKNGCNRNGVDRNGQPCNGISLPTANAAQDPEAAYRRLLEEQQKARMAQLSAEQSAEAQARSAAEQQAMQQAFESLLRSQSTSVVANWQPGVQMYVKGTQPPTTGLPGDGQGNEANTAGPVLYKAGSIVFAVLDTAVNSDNPGPVLATIVQGPLQGSKIVGDLQVQEDAVLLRFSLLSSPDLPTSVPLNAVAVDADTARTALATGVDNHYFLRYGSLFASAFLEGIGEAVLAGITQPVAEVDDNSLLVVQSADVTVGQALAVGVGTVGQQWGEQLGDIFNKPPTITVDSGTGIGLLFMKDFTVNEGVVPTVPENGQVTTQQVSATANSSEQVR